MKIHFFHLSEQRGFMILLAVLALAAVGVAVASSLFLIGISTSQTASTFQEGEQAKAAANACAESALQKLVSLSTFIGTNTLTIGVGSCTYTIVANGALADTLQISGTVGQSVRKVKIAIALPTLIITSWQEVSDF